MYIKVNNTTLYYEKKGFGRPLIMLHGNGESHDIFDVLSDSLMNDFELYLIDSRGHGLSDRNVEISYDIMANDIKAFIDQLGLINPLLFGFSDGGIVGLILAYTYPKLLSHLMIAGANLNPSGFLPDVLEDMKRIYEERKDPLYYMMINEPDIKIENLNKIEVHTLICAGSDDVISYAHTKSIHENINASKLIILDGHNHDSYIIHNDMLCKEILNFTKK